MLNFTRGYTPIASYSCQMFGPFAPGFKTHVAVGALMAQSTLSKPRLGSDLGINPWCWSNPTYCGGKMRNIVTQWQRLAKHPWFVELAAMYPPWNAIYWLLCECVIIECIIISRISKAIDVFTADINTSDCLYHVYDKSLNFGWQFWVPCVIYVSWRYLPLNVPTIIDSGEKNDLTAM